MATKKPTKKTKAKGACNNKIVILPEDVKRLASEGKGKRRIARCLGISHETFYQRLNDTPDVLDAFNEGQQERLDFEEDIVTQIEGKVLMSANQSGMFASEANQRFVLKSLRPEKWGGKTKVEHSGQIEFGVDESGDGKDEL